MHGYRDLADDLRRRINAGEFEPGSVLPKITDLQTEYEMARQTVRTAISQLANEGLVRAVRRKGTVVRDRSAVRVPLSRYSRTLHPGGNLGPWETACAEQNVDGRMAVVAVERRVADEKLAALLEVSRGSELVYRRRHALIGDEIVQVQEVWYPASLAERAGIAGTGKTVGGVYRALMGAGHTPVTVDERVSARVATPDEAAELQAGASVPILQIERVTRDSQGSVLELLRVCAVSDRIELVYDDLPLSAKDGS